MRTTVWTHGLRLLCKDLQRAFPQGYSSRDLEVAANAMAETLRYLKESLAHPRA